VGGTGSELVRVPIAGPEGGAMESLSPQRPRDRASAGGAATVGLSDYVIGLALGLGWRYGLLIAAIVVKESGYHPPLIQVAIFAGAAVTGAVIGAWRSGSVFGAVWRMVTLSVLVVFVAPSLPWVYPYVVVLAIAVATLEPFAAARKRRRRLAAWRRGRDQGAVMPDAAAPAFPTPAQQQGAQLPTFPAIYSSDGRFLWNGAAWVRLPASNVPGQGWSPAHLPAAVPSHRRRRRARRWPGGLT